MMYIHCEMIIAIKLVNICITLLHIFTMSLWGGGALEIYSLSKFQPHIIINVHLLRNIRKIVHIFI